MTLKWVYTLGQGCVRTFKRKHSIENDVAHQAVIVCGFGGEATGDFFVFVILRACPWSKVNQQFLMIRHNSPLLLDWLTFVFHPKEAHPTISTVDMLNAARKSSNGCLVQP